jgi:hypothetical protein
MARMDVGSNLILIMPRRKKDCAKELLAISNPWSIHRKHHSLTWAIVFGVVFCIGFAAFLFLLNQTGSHH